MMVLRVLLLLCPAICQAELTVFADMGGESAVRFYEGIQPEHDAMATPRPHALPAHITEADMLPVVSHQLSPGTVTPKTLDLVGMQPIFLLGADPVSLQWLTHNADKLNHLHATGLVVNVKTSAELNQLRAVVPNLTLLPAPADDLAERLPLSHYPVLITASGLLQ